MAELHAQEAPDRVWELETYGALFDRTKDGRISQRNFGGHTYARLAHVGDQTGLEIIRTLQQKIRLAATGGQGRARRLRGAHQGVRRVHDNRPAQGRGPHRRRVRILEGKRAVGRFILFEAPAIVMATGGIGKSYKVTSNSWEYTGDGHALALRAGATLINTEFVQFHPTGMVWPPSVKGILVTEGVRGDGGLLKNAEGKRFMFDYIPPVFKGQYAETEEEADQGIVRLVIGAAEVDDLGVDTPRGIIVSEVSYKGHRYPAEIIAHCVWLYHRFRRCQLGWGSAGSGR
jgi:succinate dehydrogenase / fumarate reductase flavoprotein subunit